MAKDVFGYVGLGIVKMPQLQLVNIDGKALHVNTTPDGNTYLRQRQAHSCLSN
jgi:hypothetical protein